RSRAAIQAARRGAVMASLRGGWDRNGRAAGVPARLLLAQRRGGATVPAPGHDLSAMYSAVAPSSRPRTQPGRQWIVPAGDARQRVEVLADHQDRPAAARAALGGAASPRARPHALRIDFPKI